MVLQRYLGLSAISSLTSMVCHGARVRMLQRMGVAGTAVALNKVKELDPIQKLFVEKIRDYNSKSKASGGAVDAGAEYQKELTEDISKLQRLYGGGNLEKFPEFKFDEPKFEEVPK